MDPKNHPPKKIRGEIEARLFGVVAAEWTLVSGGLSGVGVWRATHGGLSFAVRAWPDSHDHGLAIRIAEAATRAGLPFIRPPRLLLRNEGVQWEATEWADGRPLSDPAFSETDQLVAVAALARFHAVAPRFPPPSPEPSPALLKRRRLLNELVASLKETHRPAGWEQETAAISRLLPAVARKALSSCPSPEPLSTWLGVHGDARPEHFLLAGGEVTGLIDWGAATRDTPLLDVARLAGELASGNPQHLERLLETYQKEAGTPVDGAIVRFFDASGAVLAGANWLQWLSDPTFAQRNPDLVRGRLRSILARLSGYSDG